MALWVAGAWQCLKGEAAGFKLVPQLAAMTTAERSMLASGAIYLAASEAGEKVPEGATVAFLDPGNGMNYADFLKYHLYPRTIKVYRPETTPDIRVLSGNDYVMILVPGGVKASNLERILSAALDIEKLYGGFFKDDYAAIFRVKSEAGP